MKKKLIIFGCIILILVGISSKKSICGFFSMVVSQGVFKKENFVILLMGVPAAGKGRLATNLKKNFFKNSEILSLGRLFREEISKKTNLGNRIRSYVDFGMLVPEDITVKIIFAWFKEMAEQKKTIILDGYPRNKMQAEKLLKLLKNEKMMKNYFIINILLDSPLIEELYVRVENRRVCSRCQKSFNKKYKPPRVKGICDFCNGPLIRRSDDTVEKLQKRIQFYQENEGDILQVYEENDIRTKKIRTPESQRNNFIASNFKDFKKMIKRYESKIKEFNKLIKTDSFSQKPLFQI